MKEKQNMTGLRRGLETLELLSRTPGGMSFSLLRHKLDNLPAPTLSRLLKVLCEHAWVERKINGEYQSGKTFFAVAHRLSGTPGIAEIATPYIERLAAVSEESAAFAEPVEDGFMFRAKCEQPDSYHYIDLNRKNVSPTNGFNVVCRAYDSSDDSNLMEIRKKRYYSGIEPGKGIRFLAPVFCGHQGEFAGVIGISKINKDVSEDEGLFYEKLVKKTALQVSKALACIEKNNPE
jgi:DNA-binding IclR family transcriptional regulator